MTTSDDTEPKKTPFLWDMPRTRLYLIRHGQVENFHQRRLNGRTDVGLSDWGRRQYDRLARRLLEAGVGVDAVYASDLTRARVGGEVLSSILDRPLTLRPEFQEINFGQWEGLNFEELERDWPGEFKRRYQDLYHHRPPQGETIAEMEARVGAALERLIDTHRHRSFLLVAHAGVNRVILCRAIGLGPEHLFKLDQDYGCLNVIDFFDDGRSLVKLVNGVSWDSSS
ncbi:MAG: histidine phosphatase family protein [Proteobacteria bacterium]|nr:histidine phosphatase family protein [Pseudomonadota bacterium]MBU1742909.1 histidine phosphatase family protein [Pseudomonadota bacterium]